MPTNTAAQFWRFGVFEFDAYSVELRRAGIPIKLRDQPSRILVCLLEHAGQMVTREELRQLLWPSDTFVDFDHSLNTAVMNLRDTLGDSADKPLYIETLPKRGYRFVAPVSLGLASEARDGLADTSNLPALADLKGTPPDKHRPRKVNWIIAIAAVVLAALVAGYFYLHRTPRLTDRDTIVLADFTNTTGDPVFDGTLRQGLSVQLEQSPFLSLVSEQRIQQAMRMMDQPADARLTPEIAREICERTASTVVLDGSIAQIGTQYLLTIKAVTCASGESLASTEAQARDKNHVLDALAKTASGIRGRLGESLSTVQKFDTPLEQATTPSLEALKAFSSGRKVQSTEGEAAALPFFKRAIELDPNFALAYAWLGLSYANLGESSVAADYNRKAYELRDRTSEAEKYFITSRFHKAVTGNMEQAEQACQLWIQAYPRSEIPHAFLSGAIYPVTGQYEKGTEAGREAVRLNPDFPPPTSS